MVKAKIDPLTLSIIKGRLDSFNIELGDRVSNQAFSFATAHLRDLGCGLLDKEERTITTGDFFPAAGGGMDIAVKGMLDWVGRDGIKPDDFILSNDAFIVRWGHMADWTFIRPIFYNGELLFYHCLKTHQYDTGGAFRDAYYPGLFDCHGEAMMIPPLKLMKEGKLDETVYSLILRNVRGAAMVRSDNLLVYASMKKVGDRILDLLDNYGRDTVVTACDEIIGRTETAVRQAISSWPGGTYESERAADWDGTTDKQVWIRLSLTIKPDEGKLIFDFSESDPAVDYINLNLGRLWGSIVSAVAWTLPSGINVNQGLANCLQIITKEGTVLDPVYPATTGGSVITGNIAVECALVALGQAVPEKTSALWTRHLNPMLVGRRRDRIDPRSGLAQAFTVMGFQSDGGNGANWGYDGTDSYGPVNAGGGVKKAPVEVEEWEAPYRWLRWEFITDATGHGRWRGGLGTRVEILNTYDHKLWHPHDCLVQTGNFEGEKSGSLGLLDGKGGAPHRLGITRKGKRIKIRTLSAAYLQPGDILWTQSGGGGGVGDPLDRDPEKVRWDVMNEYISNKTARNIYGVVIDAESFAIDYKATEIKRQKFRAKRSDKG